MYGINDYLGSCEYRKKFLLEQSAWLTEEKKNFQSDAERLDGVLERIRQEMIGYLIPEVHDDHIAALEQRLSYPGLSPIKRKYDALFETTEQRRVELEAMDEIQHFDFQLDQAQRRVDDIQPTHDSMRAELKPWENSEWFAGLNKRGYFEHSYSAGLWRRFFDWRAVSFLMETLGKTGRKFETPEPLRVHYRELRDKSETVFEAYTNVVAERDRIAGLKSEYDEVLRSPERLLSELFHELGTATVEHLDACPEDLKLNLARNDSHLNAFLRKEIGVRKQIQYLRELTVTRIDAQLQQLEQELIKIIAKIRKLELKRQRGKRKQYSKDDLERMRNVKADKWERRRTKTQTIRRKIAEFDKHDKGSWTADYLWWDLMTGGSAADDIYEVREFRQRHPDWNYREHRDSFSDEGRLDDDNRLFDDAADDLATSMAASELDDSFHDPS